MGPMQQPRARMDILEQRPQPVWQQPRARMDILEQRPQMIIQGQQEQQPEIVVEQLPPMTRPEWRAPDMGEVDQKPRWVITEVPNRLRAKMATRQDNDARVSWRHAQLATRNALGVACIVLAVAYLAV